MKFKYLCLIAALAFTSPALAKDDCAEHGFCDAPPPQDQGNEMNVGGKPEKANQVKTFGKPAISFKNNSSSGSSFNPPAEAAGNEYGEPVDREFIMKYSDAPEVYGDLMKAEMPVMGQ